MSIKQITCSLHGIAGPFNMDLLCVHPFGGIDDDQHKADYPKAGEGVDLLFTYNYSDCAVVLFYGEYAANQPAHRHCGDRKSVV